jgi:hypothetical protein
MIRNTGDDAPSNGTIRNTRDDAPASGTTAGAETTSRMAGIHHTGEHRGDDRGVGEQRGDVRREEHVEAVRPTHRPHGVLPAKTSAAAVFSLVFGLSALFCALTAILSPAAVLFGLIGIVVGIAGLKMARRPGVTGRGTAIGGLVLSVLGLIIGAAVIAGVSVLVNDEARLDQLQNQIEDLRDDLPSTQEIRDELPS